jgi:hypothetical protein
VQRLTVDEDGAMSIDQHLSDLRAIVSPTDRNGALDFENLRDSVVAAHIGANAPQPLGHVNAANLIRRRMDDADNAMRSIENANPQFPADRDRVEKIRRDATEAKRAYTQMLDVLKRACGARCCPNDPNEQPDPRF